MLRDEVVLRRTISVYLCGYRSSLGTTWQPPWDEELPTITLPTPPAPPTGLPQSTWVQNPDWTVHQEWRSTQHGYCTLKHLPSQIHCTIMYHAEGGELQWRWVHRVSSTGVMSGMQWDGVVWRETVPWTQGNFWVHHRKILDREHQDWMVSLQQCPPLFQDGSDGQRVQALLAEMPLAQCLHKISPSDVALLRMEHWATMVMHQQVSGRIVAHAWESALMPYCMYPSQYEEARLDVEVEEYVHNDIRRLKVHLVPHLCNPVELWVREDCVTNHKDCKLYWPQEQHIQYAEFEKGREQEWCQVCGHPHICTSEIRSCARCGIQTDIVVHQGEAFRKFTGEQDRNHHGTSWDDAFSNMRNLQTFLSDRGGGAGSLKRLHQQVVCGGGSDQTTAKAFELMEQAQILLERRKCSPEDMVWSCCLQCAGPWTEDWCAWLKGGICGLR